MSTLYDIDKNGVLQRAMGNDLISVIPEGVTSIATGAYRDFSDCVCEVIMADSVTEIQDSAFENLPNLHSITMSKNLIKIGKNAFKNCENLKSIKLSGAVESISAGAFENTKKLSKFSCKAPHVEYDYEMFGKNNCPTKLADEHGFLVINDTLVRYFGNATEVRVPSGVKYINSQAFSSNLQVLRVIIPDSVEIIEREAFANCTNLREVVIAEGTKIVGTAFVGCASLADKSGLIWINGELIGFAGKTTRELIIPEGVKRIPEYFAYNSDIKGQRHKIKNIVLPDSVEEIGEFAFANNASLETVTSSAGLKRVGKKAFYLCNKLYRLDLAVDSELDEEALAGCSSVSEEDFVIYGDRLAYYKGRSINVDIPDCVRHIDSRAFMYSKISSVNLNNVETIGEYAFDGCYHLIDVCFGNKLRRIGEGAFQRTAVNIVELPDSLESIDMNAFRFCNALENVVLPDSITELKVGTFAYCENLKTINLGNIVKIGAYAIDKEFLSTYADTRRYLLTDTLMSYLNDRCIANSNIDAEEFNFSESDNSFLASILNGFDDCANNTSKKNNNEIKQLEKVVATGSYADIKGFVLSNPEIDFTARALLIAANQRGMDVFRLLVDNGYRFDYWLTSAAKRRLRDSYGSHGIVDDSKTCCPFYLGLILKDITNNLPEPLIQLKDIPLLVTEGSKRTSIEERLEIIKYLSNDPIRYGVVKDDLLMYAFMCDEIDLAHKLIEMGFSLNDMPPVYALSEKSCGTYVDILRSGNSNRYRLNFIQAIKNLDTEGRISVLTALVDYLKKFRCKLTFGFDDFNQFYDDIETFEFMVEHCKFVRVNKKYAFIRAIDSGDLRRIKKYLKCGWLSSADECDVIIDYCSSNNKIEALTLLTSYYIDNYSQDGSNELDSKLASIISDEPKDCIKSIWGYRVQPNGTIRINSYKGSSTKVVVPSEINGRQVTVIGSNAFGIYDSRDKYAKSRKNIKSIVLPDTIRVIERYAFSNSESLVNITFPSTIEQIGDYALYNCPHLQKVVLPCGLKMIPNGLFAGCLGLHEVVVPESVVSIGKSAFASCTNLSVVNIPKSIIDVGSYAFFDCHSIKELRFEAALRMLDYTAFWKMADGTDIYLGPDVLVVGKSLSKYNDLPFGINRSIGSITIHTVRDSVTAKNVADMKNTRVVY